MIGRVPREDVAFPSAPDPRFGGNLARANVGAQYPRGGVDVRYENYQRPRQVDYTRNIPQRTGTPNFRPPYGAPGAPGKPSYNEWLQRGMAGGLGSLEGQQSKVNLMDLYDRLGGDINWNRLLRQMDQRGIEYAEMDDDYGPFIPPSVLEMDIFGTDYGPQDEYDFDKKKGYENRIWGSEPNYVARGGLMSLRR